MANPATLMSTISREANEAADSLPSPNDEDFFRLGLSALELMQTINRAVLDPAASSVAPVGNAAVELLKDAKARAGLDKVGEVLGARPGSKILTLDAAFALMGLLRVVYGSIDGPFEERTRAYAAAIKHVTETVYKPLLLRVIDLDLLARSLPQTTKLPSLGLLTKQVRDTGHGVFVESDLRLVRNAEAHSSIRIDVEAEMVTFVNTSDGGAEEVLGPWTETQLHGFAENFLMRCLTMMIAMLGFVADETAEWIRQTNPKWLEKTPSTTNLSSK
jgi:hypothetical protein